MRNLRFTTMILSWTLLGGLVLAGGLGAQERPMAERSRHISGVSARPGGPNAALGLSLFAGTPSGDPFEVITGYDMGTIYTATGDAIEVTDQAIVLRRNGTYRVHLEGVLAFDPDDATADENAAGVFALLIDGVPQVLCTTPGNTSTAPVAAALGFSEVHNVVASCKVDYTIAVKGNGSDPLVFPRNSAVQAALIPNDRALGDTTLMLTRFEITRTR